MSKKPPSMASLAKPAASSTKAEVATGRADAFEQSAVNASESAKAKSTAWKEGRRVITAWIPEDQYKKLINLHVDQHRLMRVLLEEAIDDLLVKYGELPASRKKAS